MAATSPDFDFEMPTGASALTLGILRKIFKKETQMASKPALGAGMREDVAHCGSEDLDELSAHLRETLKPPVGH